MRDDSKRHGHFSLNELLTTDLASAKEFYGELLGSLGDSNLLRRSGISHLSIGWRIVVGEPELGGFWNCLQSLGSGAGLLCATHTLA